LYKSPETFHDKSLLLHVYFQIIGIASVKESFILYSLRNSDDKT